MIGVRVTVTSTPFAPEVRRMVEAQSRGAVMAGARNGALVARAVAAGRVKSGRMAAIRVDGPRKTSLGWVAFFVSPAKHAWYQNDGTLGNRRRPLRGGGLDSGKLSRAAGTGIKPLHFLYHGLGAGRKAMGRYLGVSLRR